MFPVIGQASVAFILKHVTQKLFLIVAESLSSQELDEGIVYPNLNIIENCIF